ncbi:unnamed protein product [Euphydryas editha]|uniref:Uncharacterized protein n=1 Tax=Euphydryas editha TaxID=104508 RepID=A0AAU9UUB8_EUPED|nr:unnamed protein product [Euphydryas editha]
MIQIQSKPRNLNIVQLYAPTTEGSDEDVEEFYRQAELLIKATKKHDINIKSKRGERNCVKSAKTYPGADIRSDHNPVVAEILLVLNKIHKRRINVVNIRKINDKNCRSKVMREINEWASEAKQSQETVEQ